jgi:hypothetical protein
MPYWGSSTEQGGSGANEQELASADAELADGEIAGDCLDKAGHSRQELVGMEQTEGRQSYSWPETIWWMIVGSSCQTDSSMRIQGMGIVAACFRLATSH